jgi:tetratricopeptide (TPR) repeat protein
VNSTVELVPQAELLLERARRLLEINRGDEALPLLVRFLAGNPEHVAALVMVARIHLEAGRHGPAREAAEAVLRVDPGNVKAHYARAVALARRHSPDAVDAARQALAAGPQEWRAHVAMAVALSAAERYADALVAGESGLALAPAGARPYVLVGGIAMQADRYDRAELAFRAALADDPDDPDARHALGILTVLRGQPRRGIREMVAAGADDPEVARLVAEALDDRVRIRLDRSAAAVAVLCAALGCAAAVAAVLPIEWVTGVARLAAGFAAAGSAAWLARQAAQLPRSAWPFARATLRGARGGQIGLAVVGTLAALAGYALTGAAGLAAALAAPALILVTVAYRERLRAALAELRRSRRRPTPPPPHHP